MSRLNLIPILRDSIESRQLTPSNQSTRKPMTTRNTISDERIHLIPSILGAIRQFLRLLLTIATAFYAQSALAQTEPKPNEFQAYLENLHSVRSYVCKAYILRFGTHKYQTSDEVKTFTFISTKICEIVGDVDKELQLSFVNQCWARAGDNPDRTEILLKDKRSLFTTQNLTEVERRNSDIVIGPMNPLSAGMSFLAEQPEFVALQQIEKILGNGQSRLTQEGRNFGGPSWNLTFKPDGNSGPIQGWFHGSRQTTAYQAIDGVQLPSRIYMEKDGEALWIEMDWIAINQKLPPEFFDADNLRQAFSGKDTTALRLEELRDAFTNWRLTQKEPKALMETVDGSSQIVRACTSFMNYRSLLSPLSLRGSVNDVEQFSKLQELSGLDLAKNYKQLMGGNYDSIGPFHEACLRESSADDGAFEEMFKKDLEEAEQRNLLLKYLQRQGPAGLLHPEFVSRLKISQAQQTEIQKRLVEIQQFQRSVWSGQVPSLSIESVLSSSLPLSSVALTEDLWNEEQQKELIDLLRPSEKKLTHFSIGL
jgi:hypothetical protein